MHDHVPDRLPGPGWPDVGLGRGTADLAPAAPDPDRVARPMAPGPAHATRRDRARRPAWHQRLTKRIASMTSRELLRRQLGAVWVVAVKPSTELPGVRHSDLRVAALRFMCRSRSDFPVA